MRATVDSALRIQTEDQLLRVVELADEKVHARHERLRNVGMTHAMPLLE
jgi:hypothetical protein